MKVIDLEQKSKQSLDQKSSPQNVLGYVHSIETMGLLDGPGIRTVFFLQGCMLRCSYCHNPDTQAICRGDNVLSHVQVMTPEKVLKIAKRYQPYYRENGGVTFSGGEALLQGKFVYETVKLLKENGINVCVDTSAYGDPNWYSKILPLVDTILLDVKEFSDEEHKELTGQKMSGFWKFCDALKKYFKGKIWIRHVMVPGFTDSAEKMDQLFNIILTLETKVERIEILPYHSHGIEKYRELGMSYKLEDVSEMSGKEAKRYETSLRERLANFRSMKKNVI